MSEALRALTTAIRQEAAVEGMRAEHDPLASHIFASRRHYRGTNETKSRKRREMTARLSYARACDLGFMGSFDEWERLMGAVPAVSERSG
jgi:hypothetical protein